MSWLTHISNSPPMRSPVSPADQQPDSPRICGRLAGVSGLKPGHPGRLAVLAVLSPLPLEGASGSTGD
jgi:hypothetical protein